MSSEKRSGKSSEKMKENCVFSTLMLDPAFKMQTEKIELSAVSVTLRDTTTHVRR